MAISLTVIYTLLLCWCLYFRSGKVYVKQCYCCSGG